MKDLWNYFSGWKTHYTSLGGMVFTVFGIINHIPAEALQIGIAIFIALIIMCLRSGMKTDSRNAAIAFAEHVSEEVRIILTNANTPKDVINNAAKAAPQVVTQVIDVEKAVEAFRTALTSATKTK